MENRYDYTGRPLNDDEVLTLMPYDEMDVKLNCKNRKNVVTVSKGGKSVRGVWKAVPREWAKEAQAQFNSWARTQNPVPTEGRCMVPQSDGTKKPCPRKNCDNRCSCAECPHKGEYEREIIAPVSLDQMMDEFEYDPIPGSVSAEDQFFIAEEECEAPKRMKEVLRRLIDVSPKHALAVTLMTRGIRGDQFAKELQLGHEYANQVRQQVIGLIKPGATSFDQIDVDALKAYRSKRDAYYHRRAEELSDLFE